MRSTITHPYTIHHPAEVRETWDERPTETSVDSVHHWVGLKGEVLNK